MKQREIAIFPEAPPLTPKTIELLSTLCFRENDLLIPKVDYIFIFGSRGASEEITEALKVLFTEKVSEALIISGGTPNYQGGFPSDLTPAEMIYSAALQYIPKSIKVVLEKKSENTLENVIFSLEELETKPGSLCFIAKSFHAGRACLTLKKYLPQAKLYQRCVDSPISASILEPLSVHNWPRYPESAGRVWGEFLRIKKYGEKGDIEYDSATQDLIKQINHSM